MKAPDRGRGLPISVGATKGLGGLTENWHRWRYALYDGYVTGSRDGAPLAPLMGHHKGYDGGAGDIGLGPLCFMLGYPDHCVLYRFTPRALTSTDMEVVWLVRGDAVEGQDFEMSELTWLWHQTTLEDMHIVRQTAEGINSHFFEPGPFHPERESLALEFIDWYLYRLEGKQP